MDEGEGTVYSSRAGGANVPGVSEPAPSEARPVAEGPVKATRKAKVKDGKRRERRLDIIRLQGFWPLYASFIILSLRAPFAEEHIAHTTLRLTGLGLALLGLAMRIWSMGYLLKKAELATAGPYGRTRNPLYVGTWLIGCGLALLAAWPFNLVLLGVYNVMFYFVYRAQIGIEEEMLSSIYGDPYTEYCRNVPRFFPSVKAWRAGAVSRFSMSRAFKNRAWEPVLGLLVLLTLQLLAWGLAWPAIKANSLAEGWQQFTAGGWWK